MEISLENLYVDTGAYRVNETNKNWKGWTNDLNEDQQDCPMCNFP